jgi:hypothetical protein
MSGWDASDWFWTAASGLLILLGLLSLYGLRSPALDEERASDAQLRYGHGADLARWRISGDLMTGILLIGVGALQLLHRGDPMPQEPGPLILGLFLVAFGLWSLFFEQHFERWRHGRYLARLDARLARGEDTYFEELRELRAYPHRLAVPRWSRLRAILILLCGGSFLVAAITR